MTDYKNTETAPLIFFDGAIAWGTYAGVVQIELGARALCATTDGDSAGVPAGLRRRNTRRRQHNSRGDDSGDLSHILLHSFARPW